METTCLNFDNRGRFIFPSHSINSSKTNIIIFQIPEYTYRLYIHLALMVTGKCSISRFTPLYPNQEQDRDRWTWRQELVSGIIFEDEDHNL